MQYNKDDLYAQNIHILRDLAREIGVNAPTLLNKKALINEIILIDCSKKPPCIPSNRGRPARNRGESIPIELKPIEKEPIEIKPIEIEPIEQKETEKLDLADIKKEMKKEFIATVLREIERQLNKVL